MALRITRSIVPNLLTLGNLYSGFTALVYITKDDFFHAALFVFIAAVFDMLDGVMARLINSTSELGAELDSLCDAVSFGVVPSFMLYKMYFYQFGDIGILLSSFPALGGVVRLARFNVMLTSFEDKLYFTGMPIPSAALTIISYLIFFKLNNILSSELDFYIMLFLAIAVPLVMVSYIKFDNMPRPTKKSIKQRPIVFVIFVLAILLSVITKGMAVFPFMLFYIIASSIRWFIKWLKSQRTPEDDISEIEEE